MSWMARERGWPVSTEWVILPIWLLKSSSVKVILWWSFTWYTNIFFFFCPFRGIYLHNSFSNSLILTFPIMFPASPWPSSQTIGHSSWASIKLHIRTFLLPRKVSNQVHCMEISPEDFPLPLSFRDDPERNRSATTVHLWGLGAWISQRTICKLDLGLLFLFELIIGNSPMRP